MCLDYVEFPEKQHNTTASCAIECHERNGNYSFLLIK